MNAVFKVDELFQPLATPDAIWILCFKHFYQYLRTYLEISFMHLTWKFLAYLTK